ncbi:MAG: hypothetical protein JW822_06165 [Spirochaetales bacterium]|nr:hypothetical protein [Spirochaetales bacterium]
MLYIGKLKYRGNKKNHPVLPAGLLLFALFLCSLSVSCDYYPDYNSKTVYDYSRQGNVCKETRWGFRGVSETLLFLYNPRAQLIRETRFKGGKEFDYCITYVYDDMGRLVREIKKQADGSIAYDQYIFYEINSAGTIKKAVYMNAADNSLACTIEHHFDEFGNIIRYTARDSEGDIYDDLIYEYDENGNMVHKIWKIPSEITDFFMMYDGDGNLTRYEIIAHILDEERIYSTLWDYLYIFDDQGRILKQLRIENDSFPRVTCFEYDSLDRVKVKTAYDIYSRGLDSVVADFR